jgi:hypothetical protein
VTCTSARTAYRLEIEGLPLEAVTDPEMAQTLADGRRRVTGLVRDGLQISERVDLAYAKIEAEGMTVSIVDRQCPADADAWTEALSRRPTLRQWLWTSEVAVGDTVITLGSADGISVGDVLHVGTEAMLVGGILGSSLSVTRGYWGTIPVAYVAASGADTSYYEVTDRPSSIEGRRARLYRYVLGEDDLQGDGQQVWLGVCATDASLGEGTTWSILIDSIASVLEQGMGRDLEAPVRLRGITYPDTPCFQMRFWRSTATQTPDDSDVRLEGGGADYAEIRFSGFFESNEEFCAHLSGILADLRDGNPRPEIVQDATLDPIEGATVLYATPLDESWAICSDIALAGFRDVPGAAIDFDAPVMYIGDAIAPHTYHVTGGTVPRAHLAPRGTAAVTRPTSPVLSGVERGTAPIDRPAGSDGDVFLIRLPDVDGELGEPVSARYVAAIQSLVSGAAGFAAGAAYVRELEITLARELVEGDFADLIQAIIDTSPALAGFGGLPLLTADDITPPSAALMADATAGLPQLTNRRYVLVEEIELVELVEGECRLLGIFPHLAADGSITFSRLELPTAAAPADFVIDDSNRIVDAGWPTWERNAFGSLNVIEMHAEYDAFEDEHGDRYLLRDVIALSNRRAPKRLKIEPKSVEIVPWTVDAAAQIGRHALAIYGRPYVLATLEVPYTLATSIQIGSICAVDLPRAPDVLGGGRGYVANGLVVGRMWALDMEERLTIDVLLSDDAALIAGYTPAFVGDVASDVFAGSPTVEGVTLQDSADLSRYYPIGTRVTVGAWDVAEATRASGTVTAVTSTTVTIDFDGGAGSADGSDLVLRYARSDDGTASESQLLYGYIAAETALTYPTSAGDLPADKWSA